MDEAVRDIIDKLNRLPGTHRIPWTDLLNFIVGWVSHRHTPDERQGLIDIAVNMAADPVQRQKVRNTAHTYAEVTVEKGQDRRSIRGSMCHSHANGQQEI